MRECEQKLIQAIKESKDQGSALRTAVDVLKRLQDGESYDSIAASYGLAKEGTGND